MRKILGAIVVCVGLLQVAACDPVGVDSAESRMCQVTYGPSIVALGELSVSGDVTIISGEQRGAVHGNEGVTGNGSVHVDADVFSAAGITLNGNNVDIAGSLFEGVARVDYEPAYDAAAHAAQDNDNDLLEVGHGNQASSPVSNGQLRLSGKDALVVPGGDYYFENGISISGQSTLELTGHVVFYVEGPVSMTGTTTTNDGSPYVLSLVSVSDGKIRLSGTSEARLTIHAPAADVSLSGTTTFEGSIIGHDIGLSGTTDIGLAGGHVGYFNDACKRDGYE